MKKIALAILAVAVVLGMAYIVLPASLKARFRGGAIDSPASTEQESPAPTLPFSTCIDGSPVTVLSQDDNQINYRCGSGTTGWYLKPKK